MYVSFLRKVELGKLYALYTTTSYNLSLQLINIYINDRRLKCVVQALKNITHDKTHKSRWKWKVNHEFAFQLKSLNPPCDRDN